jgi:hypothetical protein
LVGGTEENHGKSQSKELVSGLRFEAVFHDVNVNMGWICLSRDFPQGLALSCRFGSVRNVIL